MKIKSYVSMGVAALSLGVGLAATHTTANAYTTYKSVPRAMRGYYISRPGNLALTITQHSIMTAIPQADFYKYHVTSVSYSKHYYHIHAYINYGRKIRTVFKLHHYSKYRLTSDGYKYSKVKAKTISYFLNHPNPYSEVY